MPKVSCSVVIPSFNCAQYLENAIFSCLIQRFEELELEIIVVNDGSSDNSLEVLVGLQMQYPLLKVITTQGIGVSEARNLAVQSSSADYIAFLDADDVWWANKLKNQLQFHVENPHCLLSFTDYLHHSPENQLKGTCFEFWKPAYILPSPHYSIIKNAEHELLAMNVVGTSTVVANRAAIVALGGFVSNINTCEDWDLWLKLAHIGEVACANVVTMSYLMRPQSITSNFEKRIDAMQNLIAPYGEQPYFSEAYRVAVARINIAKAELARQKNKSFEAFTHHFKAFMVLKSKRLLVAMLSDALNMHVKKF